MVFSGDNQSVFISNNWPEKWVSALLLNGGQLLGRPITSQLTTLDQLMRDWGSCLQADSLSASVSKNRARQRACMPCHGTIKRESNRAANAVKCFSPQKKSTLWYHSRENPEMISIVLGITRNSMIKPQRFQEFLELCYIAFRFSLKSGLEVHMALCNSYFLSWSLERKYPEC